MDRAYRQLLEIAENEVDAAIAALPDSLREHAENIPVTFAPFPQKELIETDDDEDLLGLFVGDAFPDQGENEFPFPPQIFLFLENLWDFTEENPKTFRKEVRKTYLHEFGHFVGLDEDDLIERGMD